MTKPTNELPPYVISSDPNLKILGDSEVLWIKDLASSTAIDYEELSWDIQVRSANASRFEVPTRAGYLSAQFLTDEHSASRNNLE